MASSDVIELGSSDDEAEPVPKKKKPTLNAMVHFPNEVPGLVIKPVKTALPNLQKVLSGGAVTITNVKKGKAITQVNKAKMNGRSVQKLVQKSPLKIPVIRNVSITKPVGIHNFSLNPLSIVKKQQNIRVQGPKLSLPPGITVKRTATSQNTMSNVTSSRKHNLKRKQPGNIITTVELDDEEVPLTTGTSPQWYLRPEEQTNKPVEENEDSIKYKQSNDEEKNVNMEMENNKEPDTKSYIEITIEDSPIKPLHIIKGFEVGSELPITIEDSPIKPLKSVKENLSSYDSEYEKSNITEPQSKKRLDYPKDVDDSGKAGNQNIVEIDLQLVPNALESKENTVEVENIGTDMIDETNEDSGIQRADTPKRVHTVLITKEVKDDEKSNTSNLGQTVQSGEFHPIYQKFIDLCFELENSDDMGKIVDKKIKTYYRQCPKDYVESDEFIDMVSSKIVAMKGAPDKMYLYIKDIVDELNLQRKCAKAVVVLNKENKKAEDDKCSIAEDGEYDSKRRRQIRKLDKTIKKLHRAIQKLEEQEVEFEDEEDSVYLLTERYKERLIRVHAKFCQLTNTKMPSEPRIQIEARPGLPTGPAKRLEKWVNKKVPIGTPLPFPDFHDVLQCVRDANDEDRLGLNEADIMEEARDLFTRCGKKLQRRRQDNEWRIAAARISHDVSAIDPAEKSDDLRKKLEDNKALAAKKEIELLNKYADKQNQLKLVGEEIGDKEAEESPVESEDDEGNDESNSLEDKQKRKERLKRLLHEKTRKMSSEKENIINEAKVNEEENEVAREEKMECDAVLQETENKKEDIQKIVNEAEVNTNDTTIHFSEDGPSKEQKTEKHEFDLYEIGSDIDELHLLQKLYSENEINSSTQESDSDTPIAISDTLESESDNENMTLHQNDDIISIENSSYSESEVTKDESETRKAIKEVKDKRIENLLLQNAEILLLSSSSRHKLDVEEENILLASSEEDNDVDTHLPADYHNLSICGTPLSSNESANNDCEVILDNCDENSEENCMKTYEVSLNKQEIGIKNKRIILSNSENNILNNIENSLEFNETVSQQINMQLGTYVKNNDTRNISVLIEKNEENINSNKVITNKDSSLEVNSIALGSESDTKNIREIDSYECEKKDENNSPIDHNNTDEVELKINKESNSKYHNNVCNEYEICPEPNVKEGNNESASDGVITMCKEQDFKEFEVMDVNVDIGNHSSLINP